jgi:hypothetical protein
MSDEEIMEQFAELMMSLLVTLAPILLRAYQAGLVSVTEQAEIATLQAAVAGFYMDAGGNETTLETGSAAIRARLFGGAT